MSTVGLERVTLLRPRALPGVELLRITLDGEPSGPIFQSQYVLALCLEGVVEIDYRGRLHRLERGLLALQQPGEIARPVRRLTPKTRHVVVFMDPGLLREAVANRFGDDAGPPTFRDYVFWDPELDLRLKHLLRSVEDEESSLAQRRCWAVYLDRLLNHRSDDPVAPSEGIDRAAVRRVKEFIETNYAQNISLDDLSIEAGLSKFHLLRVFRSEVGVPPHAFLTSVRIEHARRFIPTGRTLASIAADTGFADQSHLTRVFHRVFGVTPGQYLRAAR
jgi:AraC-like DNA-binding protein